MAAPIVRSTIAANVVFPLLATTAVYLRFLTRRKKGSRLYSDDWTTLGALIPTIAVCMLGLYAVSAGIIGRDVNTVTFEDVVLYKKLLFAGLLLIHIVYGLVKISAVLMYKRIFDTRRFVLAVNVIMAIISIWMVLSFFMVLFCAKGVSGFWLTPSFDEDSQPAFGGGNQYVLKPASLVISMVTINIILDLIVIVLPLPVISGLNLSFKRKVYLSSVFLLGAFCLVCSSARLFWARKLYFLSEGDTNQFEVIDNNQVWANVEACVSVVTTCLPTIYTLFRPSSRTPNDEESKEGEEVSRKITWNTESFSRKLSDSKESITRKMSYSKESITRKMSWPKQAHQAPPRETDSRAEYPSHYYS